MPTALKKAVQPEDDLAAAILAGRRQAMKERKERNK